MISDQLFLQLLFPFNISRMHTFSNYIWLFKCGSQHTRYSVTLFHSTAGTRVLAQALSELAS